MALFLDEYSVSGLVSMQDALDAVEEVFREQASGSASNMPRMRAPLKEGVLRITAGVLSYRGYYGIKVSSTNVFGRNSGRMFSLYREATGELCAVLQVFGMGALRTGAASGVATKYLANEAADTLGVLGSGRQARTQVDAICRVRPIRTVKVFSPNKEHREAFCSDLSQALRIPADPVESPEHAVLESEIIVTATTSKVPVVQGEWLMPGAHINAIGANYEFRRELDRTAVMKANFIATDDTEQVRYESTDLVEPVREGLLTWDRVFGLSDVVSGRVIGRSSNQSITLFKSLGVAIEDVALAIRAYERALVTGVGVPIPDLAG